MTAYPHLLSPITLRGMTLPNRVIMGSMHTGLEETGDWDRLAAYYAERAEGGVGLIVTGGVAPTPAGAVFPGAAALTTEAEVAHHRGVTAAVHAAGGRIALQLLHAGRYAYSPAAVAPAALKAPIAPFPPNALDAAGIEAEIAGFAQAASLAMEAGYDGIEVMGSEGYFINQFLAPATNRRDDGWGGDRVGRMRLALEITARVRAALGDGKLLIFRISLMDLVPGGQDWADVVALAQALEDAGVDILNSGIGWHEARVPTIAMSVPRGVFTAATARLRPEVGVPVVACNRINTPEAAEAVLAGGQADMISMARPFLADSQFVKKAAEGRGAEIAPCIACNQACLDHTFAGKVSSCLVNPRACHETELVIAPAAAPRRIAVVGAGAAGLACAITAASRGHDVTLFEAAGEIGGQMRLAAQIPGKAEFQGLLAWYRAELARTGVAVRLGSRADAAALAPFEAVVIATGVAPRDPALPGQADGPVVAYDDLLSGRAEAGARVVIVGAGGIGFDVASYLVAGGAAAEDPDHWRTEWGVGDPAEVPAGLAPDGPQPAPPAREVVMLQRRAEKPGKRLGKTTGWIHRAHLRAKGVRMLAGVEYRAVLPGGIEIAREGRTERLDCDTIVLCAGQEPVRGLAAALAGDPRPVHVIGGAEAAVELDAKRAIDAGTRLAAAL